MIRRTLSLIIALLAIVSLTLAVAAQSGGSYSMLRSVVGNGGTSASGGSYTLNGTVGQSAVGLSGDSSTALSSGFWTSGIVVPTAIQLVLTGSATAPITVPAYLIILCLLTIAGLLLHLRGFGRKL